LVREWREEVINCGEAAGHYNAQNNYIYFLTVERIKLLIIVAILIKPLFTTRKQPDWGIKISKTFSKRMAMSGK
jgi:hypothetical protein